MPYIRHHRLASRSTRWTPLASIWSSISLNLWHPLVLVPTCLGRWCWLGGLSSWWHTPTPLKAACCDSRLLPYSCQVTLHNARMVVSVVVSYSFLFGPCCISSTLPCHPRHAQRADRDLPVPCREKERERDIYIDICIHIYIYIWACPPTGIGTLQGTDISHLGKRKLIFNSALGKGYVSFLKGTVDTVLHIQMICIDLHLSSWTFFSRNLLSNPQPITSDRSIMMRNLGEGHLLRALKLKTLTSFSKAIVFKGLWLKLSFEVGKCT